MRIFKKGPAIPEFFPYQALVLLCLFSLAYTVTAQTLTTGQVLGRLTDPSGATVPQARIELRDTATGSVRATTTDEAGQYTFSQVTPGSYSVTAIAAGFAHAVVSSVTVEVGKSSTINIELSLGKTTETIEEKSDIEKLWENYKTLSRVTTTRYPHSQTPSEVVWTLNKARLPTLPGSAARSPL